MEKEDGFVRMDGGWRVGKTIGKGEEEIVCQMKDLKLKNASS